MADELNKLVVIQDGLLVSMANSADFVKEFPFLRGLRNPTKPASKPCCGGGVANKVLSETFQAAKRTIAGLGSAKKQQLKTMLKAKQVRVLYANPAGRSISLTF